MSNAFAQKRWQSTDADKSRTEGGREGELWLLISSKREGSMMGSEEGRGNQLIEQK